MSVGRFKGRKLSEIKVISIETKRTPTCAITVIKTECKCTFIYQHV